jgi:hypothetical protein
MIHHFITRRRHKASNVNSALRWETWHEWRQKCIVTSHLKMVAPLHTSNWLTKILLNVYVGLFFSFPEFEFWPFSLYTGRSSDGPKVFSRSKALKVTHMYTENWQIHPKKRNHFYMCSTNFLWADCQDDEGCHL